MPPFSETFVLPPLSATDTPGPPAVIVKSLSEMSKKMLPTACTLRRASLVGVLGTVMFCEPSFVIPAATVEKVAPPSVDTRMSTVATLIDPESVPATSQLTVSMLPPVQLTAELAVVT